PILYRRRCLRLTKGAMLPDSKPPSFMGCRFHSFLEEPDLGTKPRGGALRFGARRFGAAQRGVFCVENRSAQLPLTKLIPGPAAQKYYWLPSVLGDCKTKLTFRSSLTRTVSAKSILPSGSRRSSPPDEIKCISPAFTQYSAARKAEPSFKAIIV